jgi:hypothetical protein
MPLTQGYYPATPKPARKASGLAPRDRLSRRKRALRDRSTKGSPPMTLFELGLGFRKMRMP